MKDITTLPVGTLLVDPTTGAAFRKVSAEDSRTAWRSHEQDSFGWGSTGTLSDAEYSELTDALADDALTVVWMPSKVAL
ncbi:hypothetical protein Mlaev_00650 [Microbacterium laevaniformans]|uniref:Uncharacterized protein n=1 Tax=Microbacterium laevaniformans TaxID=36807 RepID=A0A150HH41_9MICO|nr:hypothetical protein [Microbacterium laevaniformans]KXZ61391.1 hypothetical protein Mlaev_00650 [Microbacterium laevaniformans]